MDRLLLSVLFIGMAFWILAPMGGTCGLWSLLEHMSCILWSPPRQQETISHNPNVRFGVQVGYGL
jgi:hypothetical protein